MTSRSRLRGWVAFGLRGRIVGAVLVTTVVTLGVAALVLLPQLEKSLRNASKAALLGDIKNARPQIVALAQIPYRETAALGVRSLRGTAQGRQAEVVAKQLATAENHLAGALGATDVLLIGYIDASGHSGRVVGSGNDADEVNDATSRPDPIDDVATAYVRGRKLAPYISFGNSNGKQVVRAAIPVGDDAVVAIRKSIDEIPNAVQAVGSSFEVAALAGLVLTALLAIPLAATLVRRLQRLREAAQAVAEEGTGAATFPSDRARDEVGDLARSFAIMQRRLAHQESARKAFVATASHELRTPLASLEGMLELVADDLQGSDPDLEEAAALLDRARVQSRRLSRLAADLLDLSRIDADVALRSEPVELGELGRAVLAEFELGLASRGVTGQITDGGSPVWVRADPGKVAQILRILLDNALRVAPRGSAVTVRLSNADPATLTVMDSGPGVAASERELIFERFKRGASTGGEAGFGLGLAIGRELARRMGGDLTLAAATDGGAAFRLSLATARPPSSVGDDEPFASRSHEGLSLP